MPRIAFIVFALSFLSTTALARKGPKAPRVPSSEERKKQSVTADAQPFTLFLGTVGQGFTSGAAVGQFLTSDTVVRATARSGKSCLYERCSYVETSASITVQHFVANSFFLEGGAMFQNNIYHRVPWGSTSWQTDDNHYTYSAETYGGTIALGNQWQFDSFTIGVRWVQVYQAAFARRSKVHADTAGHPVGREQKERLRALEHETKFYLPSLALGFSF